MHEIKTILIFSDTEFTRRDYARLGLDILLSHGFSVGLWDLSRVTYPKIRRPVASPVSFPPGIVHRRYTGRKEFRNAVRSLNPSVLVLCFVGYSWKTFFIYRALSLKQIPYAVRVTDPLPAVKRFANPFTLDAPVKALDRGLNRLVLANYSPLGVTPAGLFLAGGEKSCRSPPYPVDLKNGRTRLVALHALDYDTYLQEKDRSQPGDDPIAVFLDSNDFFHLDLRYMGIPIPPWVESFYADLRAFFDQVERARGVKIVIAAHPLSQYTPGQRAHFGEREVILGRTAELVRRSRFVITGPSTAVNLAVLFGKPVVFVTSHDYESYPFGPIIEAMAGELGKEPVYLDEPLKIDWDRELTVDGGVYHSYVRSYIKMEGSPDLPFWEIFSSFLEAWKGPERERE